MREQEKSQDILLADLKLKHPDLFGHPGQGPDEILFGVKDPEDADRNALSLNGAGYRSVRTSEEFMHEFSPENRRGQKRIFYSIDDYLKMQPSSKR